MNATPVLLITYNRPLHTEKVLQSLKKHNVQNLYIFSDGPKSDKDLSGLYETRLLFQKIDWTHPTIIEHKNNLGLANSIISAVNFVFQKFDRIILLEDDCVPQRYFFDFIENCLAKYCNQETIFGISGYTVSVPKAILDHYPYDLYFFPRIGSWGWATWRNRWQYFEHDLSQAYHKAVDEGIDLEQGGDDVPHMLRQIINGQLKDVWTLNWVLSVYLNKGYYIYPTRSHIENIGMDGSGVHCNKTKKFTPDIADSKPVRFPDGILFNEQIYKNFRTYYDVPQAFSIANKTSSETQKNPQVVHLCTQDFGGAGKAAYRLHKGLQQIGVASRMLVMNKKSGDPSVKVFPPEYPGPFMQSVDIPTYESPIWQQQILRWQTELTTYQKRPAGLEMFTDALSDIQLEQIQEIRDAEIINLHWVAGILDYPAAPLALKDKKIVWTLHDMNPFTGGCHYSGDCEKYKENCGGCPQLGSLNGEDLSRQIWAQKYYAFQNLDLNIVTPSKWLASCASESSLLSGFPVNVIPYGFPLDTFRPYPKSEIRKSLNIPENAKVILFGADSIVNARKGFVYLLEALKRLPPNKENAAVVLTFGNFPQDLQINTDHQIYNLGSLTDENQIALAYSAADVFVIPSLEDNLPNTVVEAMACGVPVVGFKIGGIPDMIEHKKNGFLAKPMDIDSLLEGIEWTLSACDRNADISSLCRETSEDKFALEIQAKTYKELYDSLLTNQLVESDGNCVKQFANKDQGAEEAASLTPMTAKDSSDKFLVSAIVSTYNSERFIKGCLEDLENQTIADRLEIIVVNSGSQQNEEEIIKKFQDQYSNINYIKTEQRETVYAAWNRGIKAATGKYITNANTDDRHRPDAIEIMARALEESPAVGAVYAENLITDKENETFEKNTARQYFNRPNFNLRQMLLFSFFGPQPMWRRSVHQKIGYFDASLSVAGDYEFFIRLARKFGVLHIGEILGLYTCRDGSIENGNRGRCISETLQVLKCYRDIIPLEELYPGLKSEKEPGKALGACLADQGNCRLFGDLPDVESALTYYNRALENGYDEPALTANLGVALWLSGKQAQGMELLQRMSDRARPAAHNAALIKRCLDNGELPQVGQFEVAEIHHPVVAGASSGNGVIIEEGRFVPVQTVEKSWSGSDMVRGLPHKTDRAVADSPHSPLVSVIVRTMNRPIFLEECLTSLSAQTFKDFEVVAINDGGVNVDTIIEKYSQRMRIQYKQHPSNKGRSAALNTGLKSARGKYFTYLDDDDRVFPDHLEILVNELESGEFLVVYSDSFEVRQEPIKDTYKTVGKRAVYSVDYDRDLLRKTNYIPILNLIHHRDCADKIGRFDENLTVLEDWDYWIRLSEHYDFKHIPKITAEYRVRSDCSNATAAEAHQFPVCRQRIRTKLSSPPESQAKRTEKPLVSMVILTCNQLEYTRKCLDSIFEHTKAPFELIIVDNGSTDGTVEFLESEILKNGDDARIKIIKNNENKGFAGGNNQGMAAASGDYILLMNNDVVVTPGWLERMLSCAEKRPEIGIVGPRSNYVSGPQLVEEVDYDTQTLKGLAEFSNKFAAGHAAQVQQVLRVVGFCMLIKRAVIDKIGAMDDRYGLGNFEDDDFSLRAAIAGFQSWIARDCFVHHFGHRTFIGEKVDLNKSLHKNWGVFKEKWGLPVDKPYGSPYSLSEMKHTRFDPSNHYYPLGNERAAMDKSNDDFESVETSYSAIMANLNSKPSQEVIEDLQRLLESYPEFALAYNDLGVLYYSSGNKEKALECYERAVQLDPDNSNFSKNLADFYFVEMGQVEEALQIYVKILKLNPQDIETLLITGHICVALHQFEDAKVFYRRVLELEPHNEAAQSNLNKLDKMDPIAPELKSPEEMYQEIQPYLNNGDPHKAISLLEKLLQSYPDFALAHNDLGVLYYHTGNKEKARHHYGSAVELMPANINFQKNLADFLFVEQGMVEEALQIYVNILATNPDDVETLLITGHICVALEKFDDAMEFYKRVLALTPGNEEASKNLQALMNRQVERSTAKLDSLNDVNVSSEINESIGLNAEESDTPDTESKRIVSIVISLNGIENRVKECLKSIQEHTLEPYELFLIDYRATKGIRKWAQNLIKDKDHYHIIECTGQAGRAEFLNQTIQQANGEIVVLMHNDVAVPQDWLKAFKMCLMHEPNIGVVGPMSNRAAGIQQLIRPDDSDRLEFESVAEAFREQNEYRRVPTRQVSDFCLAFRRDLPDKIGFFDEQFASEEVIIEDFCNRAVSEGYQNLIAADTYVFHYDRHKIKKNDTKKHPAGDEDRKKYNEKWNGAQSQAAKAFQTVLFLSKANELSQKGQIDRAVEIVLHAIGIAPEEKRLYLGLAETLLAAKRFQDAKEALNEMPPGNGNPEIEKALLLGHAEEGLENYEAARACIEKVLGMDPEHASSLNLKGILAYRNNDHNSAEKYFKRAIASDPGYGESYTNLALLHLEAEQAEEALGLFEKGFILSPADLDIANNYHAFIEGLGDFARAENVARQAADLYPNNQKIKYMLIDFLVQQGKYEMAMPEIEDAIIKFGIDDGILGAALKLREKLGPMTVKTSSKKVPVSLCMIIKNEQKYLARCLASLKPIVDEMIVVDTGSTDRSKDIAITLGAQVYDYDWENDFAAARNFSISKASGEWILIMDGDEVISHLDYDAFKKIVAKKPKTPVAYSITTRNYNKLANIVGWMPNDGQYPDEEAAIGWLPSEKVRLFYGKDQIRFEGAVHELVDPVLKRKGIEIKQCSIPVHHYGRLDKEKLERKGEIYFDIGHKKLSEKGEDVNALRELAIQATILEKNQQALELWQRLLALNPDPNLAAIAYVNLGTIHCRLEKFDDALYVAKRAVECAPDLKEAHYNRAMAELHCGNAQNSISILESLLNDFPDYPPAQFILSAAYCCANQKEKGIDGIRKLKNTPLGAHLEMPCIELAQSLLAANKVQYALGVLGAAIECDIVNKEILDLFTECLKMKDQTHKLPKIPPTRPTGRQLALFEDLPQ
jgi:GT2 family glycosyltransferase/Flp pilus assembly protein TadD/glycosyltransferase involved in cell wall biosynthesis